MGELIAEPDARRFTRRQMLGAGAALAVVPFVLPEAVEAKSPSPLGDLVLPETQVLANPPEVIQTQYRGGSDGLSAQYAFTTDGIVFQSRFDKNKEVYTRFRPIGEGRRVSDALVQARERGFVVTHNGKTILVTGDTQDTNGDLQPALLLSTDSGHRFSPVELPAGSDVLDSVAIPNDSRYTLHHDVGPRLNHGLSILDTKTGEYTPLSGNADNAVFITDVHRSPTSPDKLVVAGLTPIDGVKEKATQGWGIVEIDLKKKEITGYQAYEFLGVDFVDIATDNEGEMTGLYLARDEAYALGYYTFNPDTGYALDHEIDYRFLDEDLTQAYQEVGTYSRANIREVRIVGDRLWAVGRSVTTARDGTEPTNPLVVSWKIGQQPTLNNTFLFRRETGGKADEIAFVHYQGADSKSDGYRVNVVADGRGIVSFPTDEQYSPSGDFDFLDRGLQPKPIGSTA